MKYVFVFLMVLLLTTVSAFEITEPEENTYNSTIINLNIENNETLDNISYQLNNESIILACENCSSYNQTLNLTEGNHTIEATGVIGNNTFTDTVEFSILLPIVDENITLDFSLTINSPTNKTYNITSIPLDIEANETLDEIGITIDSYFEVVCENCSSYNGILNLSEEDDYTLTVQGKLANLTKEVVVAFTVEEEEETEEEQDNENETYPRFTLGFEKLPKLLESGEISDEELADIIRNNKLNPGIINRLIKTGLLGNSSIEAILDTQFKPTGILRKLLNWIGFKQETYASLIYENYNLTQKANHKILARDDLPKGYANKIQEKMQQQIQRQIKIHNVEQDVQNQDNNKKAKQSLEIGRQNNGKQIPPGLAKKQNQNNGDSHKTSSGLGKNNNNGMNGYGNGNKGNGRGNGNNK